MDKAKTVNNYRSNLHATVTLHHDAKLSIQHHEVLKKTPFWRLYNYIINRQLTSKMCTKHDSDILKIIKTYDHVKGVFMLGNTEKKFEERDFTAVFGINYGKHPIQKSASRKPNSPFVARRLASVDRIVASHVRSEALNAAAGKKKTDREDFARFLVLHTLITLFFTNSAPNIGWDMLNYVEDLSQIKDYAWSSRIYGFLMDSIAENENRLEKVISCVVSILHSHPKVAAAAPVVGAAPVVVAAKVAAAARVDKNLIPLVYYCSDLLIPLVYYGSNLLIRA